MSQVDSREEKGQQHEERNLQMITHQLIDISNKEEYMAYIKRLIDDESQWINLGIQNNQQKQQIIEQWMKKYQQNFRQFYYTSAFITNQKGNMFLDEILREVYPVKTKFTAQTKFIFKLFCKIFIQELAQTIFEELNKQKGGKTNELSCQLINYAYKTILKRKRCKYGVSRLFEYIL